MCDLIVLCTHFSLKPVEREKFCDRDEQLIHIPTHNIIYEFFQGNDQDGNAVALSIDPDGTLQYPSYHYLPKSTYCIEK